MHACSCVRVYLCVWELRQGCDGLVSVIQWQLFSPVIYHITVMAALHHLTTLPLACVCVCVSEWKPQRKDSLHVRQNICDSPNTWGPSMSCCRRARDLNQVILPLGASSQKSHRSDANKAWCQCMISAWIPTVVGHDTWRVNGSMAQCWILLALLNFCLSCGSWEQEIDKTWL